MNGEMVDGEKLPSIRALANDLRVSVITTKRAYADLETQGFIVSVPGKGSFVAGGNAELLREGRLREIEALLQEATRKAKEAGITQQQLHELIDLFVEEDSLDSTL